MNIYIGFDVNGKPTSVLLAKNREQADIAWAGMNDSPHNVEVIDPNNEDIGVHGLTFLLTSTIRHSRDLSHRVGGFEFRHWKRGI